MVEIIIKAEKAQIFISFHYGKIKLHPLQATPVNDY